MTIRVLASLAVFGTLAWNPNLHAQSVGGQVSFSFQFGSALLDSPTAAAVDRSGNIYVADAGTGDILQFTGAGTYTRRFTTSAEPRGVAVAGNGDIYFSEGANRRVVRVTPSGSQIIKTVCDGIGDCVDPDGPGPEPAVYRPEGVAVDAQNNLWVTGTYHVQKYVGGTLALEFQLGGIVPRAIAVDPSSGNIVFYEKDSGFLLSYTPDGKQKIAQFSGSSCSITPTNSCEGRFGYLGVGGIAIDNSGNIYATDPTYGRVHKFSSTGAYLSTFGTPGSGDGEFGLIGSGAAGIAIDSIGRIIVVDGGNHRVEVFAAGGDSRTVESSTGKGKVTFTTDAGTFTNLVAVPGAGLPPGKPVGALFPYGVFYWTVTGLNPGQAITMTITLPEPITPKVQYWKVMGAKWVRATSLLGSDDGDNILTLTITDGGFGDADGLVNGSVTDPGGPASATMVPFASFQAKAEVKMVAQGNYSFEVKEAVTLGTASDGIFPLTEDATVQLGTLELTIPAGSFKRDSKGRFRFEGNVNGVTLSATITPLSGASFEFKAEGANADLTGLANPMTVGLAIGNDSGSAKVKAEFE